MRILLISNMYPSQEHPTFGIFVRRMEEGWDRLPGVSTVRRIVRRRRATSPIGKLLDYAGLVVAGLRAMRTSDHDLVYAHFLSWHMLAVAFVASRRPVVVHLHGSDVIDAGPVLRAVQRRVVARARAVVVPSRYFAGVVRERLGPIAPERMIVSPSGGVSDHFFDPGAGPDDESVLRIGYVSALTPGKGWRTFLAALERLADRPDWEACVVGSGPDEAACRTQIADGVPSGRVRWRGAVEPARLHDVFASLDVLVFPSTRSAESLGLVPLEAMASGVWVIGSRCAAIPEYIEDGQNGELVEPGDPEAVEKALRRVLDLDRADVRARRAEISRSVESYRRSTVMQDLLDRLQPMIAS